MRKNEKGWKEVRKMDRYYVNEEDNMIEKGRVVRNF